MPHRSSVPRPATSSHTNAARPLHHLFIIVAVLAIIAVGTACEAPVDQFVPAASPFTPAPPAAVTPPTASTRTVTTPACWTTLPAGTYVTRPMWDWFVSTASGLPDSANHRCDPTYLDLPNHEGQLFPSQTTLKFAPGTFTLDANTRLMISSANNVIIDGTGATIKQAPQACSATADGKRVASGKPSSSVLMLDRVSNVTLKNLTIVGGNTNAPNNYNEPCATGHAIQMYSLSGLSNDVSIIDNTISNSWADPIYLNKVKRVLISGNTLTNAGRESIGVMNYTSDITIDQNVMSGAGYRIGVDVEPNSAAISEGDTAFGSSRLAITNNTLTGMSTAAVYLSAHPQVTVGSVIKAPVVITDVTIDGNTTTDAMEIHVEGNPLNNSTGSPQDRLNSGDVRRVQVSGNVSTLGGALIIFKGATYATATGNTSPNGTLRFTWKYKSLRSCFGQSSSNTGYKSGDLAPAPDAQLPPNSLSVDQFLTRLAVNQSGPGSRTTRDLIKYTELAMCQGNGTESEVATLFPHVAEPALHNTTYADRLATVLDQWLAATGELPPTAALATSQANLDPGSTVLAGSPAALAVATSILDAHPDLTTVSDASFLTTVLTNAFWQPPSAALLASAGQTLASGTTRQEFLASIGSFSSGGQTVQAALQPVTDFVTSSLSITASLPTPTELETLAQSGTTQDQYATNLLNGPEFADFLPLAWTPGI